MKDLLKILQGSSNILKSLGKIFQDPWRHIYKKKKAAICRISKLCMCAVVRIYFNRDLSVL